CHDLVRAYAVEVGAARPGGPGALLAATRRMLDHYLHTALAARQHINPAAPLPAAPPPRPGVSPERIVGYAEAMDWFAVERPVLICVLAVAVSSGLDTHAQQLAVVLSDYLNLSGQWQEWEDVLRISLAAAQRRGDQAGQGWAELHIGDALTHLGRISEAPPHLEAARRLFARSGDHAGRGNALCIMAVVHSEHRRFAPGLDHGRQSLAAYRQAGHLSGQAMALRVISWSLTELGQHEEALTCCRQGLEITAQTGDHAIAARIKDTMGLICLNRGRYAQAVAYHLEALGECREFGHRWAVADALIHLGQAYLARGDTDLARRVWQEAIGILDDLCHPDADDIRARLGHLDHSQAQPGVATSLWRLTAPAGSGRCCATSGWPPG
ncbi:MAG TPA: tetratricopeptide repeat protein, partial [Streptosporangiaceae bacterium]